MKHKARVLTDDDVKEIARMTIMRTLQILWKQVEEDCYSSGGEYVVDVEQLGRRFRQLESENGIR